MRLALAFVAVLAADARADGPIDPAKLEPIATKPGGHGAPTLVFSAAAPADALLRAIEDDSFWRLAATILKGTRWHALFVNANGSYRFRDERSGFGMASFKVDASSAAINGTHFDLTSAPK